MEIVYGIGVPLPNKLNQYLDERNRGHIFHFLMLPGEIRNKIYDLVFEDCIVEISVRGQIEGSDESLAKPTALSNENNVKQQGVGSQQQKAKYQTISENHVSEQDKSETHNQRRGPRKCRRRRRQRYASKEPELSLCHKIFPPPRRLEWTYSAKYKFPAQLFFICRDIYSEAITVAYSKTTFRFASPEVINSFISTTSHSALGAIRSLEITYTTPAEPELTVDEKFKIQADFKWHKTCERIREQMPAMKQLKLDLTIQDWPIQLQWTDTWARAIFCLRGKGLDRCDATLSHESFDKKVLVSAQKTLEVAMMSREGGRNKIEQDKKFREDRIKATPVRALKSLRITNIPMKKQAPKA